MPADRHHFAPVTLLVTHYNRSRSLETLLESFRALGISFGDIVVSDDASKPEHADRLKELSEIFGFRLITTPANRGLANNINKGQDAVTTPYTIYVQEDFVPKPLFAEKLRAAIGFLDADPGLDIARFYAYTKYPFLSPKGEGFSEMQFGIWKPGYMKFHMYSDHPHLRRSDFLKRFGRYKEGIRSDAAEYRMAIAFVRRKGRGLFYEDFRGLFDQVNSSAEPSTVKRHSLRQTPNPVITAIRHLYRNVKFNFDYFFARH